jgi:outer membrane protein assembly factor BamB
MRMAPALIPQESMAWLRSLEGGRKSIFINHYPQDTSVLNYFDVTRELKRLGVEFEIGGHWHRNCVMDYDGIPAVLGRSAMTDRDKPAGYNVFVLWPDRVTVSERRLFPHSTVQLPPWHEQALAPVRDTVQYDADGIPESYPWMRYDVNRQYPQVREVWKFREEGNIAAGFARSGDRAWYTTASGDVRCIRVRDGKLLWNKDFPGKIFSTPAVSGKYVVFGCTDGKVYALDACSGEVRWTAAAGKSVLGSPVIHGGRVFIGASDGCFRALELKTGRPVWTFDGVEGFVECRPWVDAEQVVFGSWANRLYSLSTATGALQWVWQCKRPSRMFSPAATWPVKSAGRIFIAVPDRKVYAIDAATGKELFTADGGREAIGLSEDGRRVYAKTMWNTSYAFPASVAVPQDGVLPREAESWRVVNGAHYEIGPSAISECGGMVITPTDKGNLFALDSRDGSLLWYHKLSVALVNPVEAWKEKGSVRVLVSTMDGVVSLLEIPVGQ